MTEVIHAHAVCRDCSWEDRTDDVNEEARAHANGEGHTVTLKQTTQTEIWGGATT